jgi:hypothetical protein
MKEHSTKEIDSQSDIKVWRQLQITSSGLLTELNVASGMPLSTAGKSKRNKPFRCSDPRAKMLRARYHAMIQRCYKDTHVSSVNYKGRGIKVLFTSLGDFVQWALDLWPTTNFKGLDFDRIDNSGHYSKENLRLVTRLMNLRNTRASKWSFRTRAEAIITTHPNLPVAMRTIWNMLQMGVTEKEIFEKVKSGELKSRNAILSNAKVLQARNLIKLNLDLSVGEKQIMKLYRKGLTDQDVIAHVNKHKELTLSIRKARQREESALQRASRLGIGFADSTVRKLIRSGLSDEQLVAAWEKSSAKLESISQKIERLGLKLSVATTHRLMRQGMEDAQLEAYSKKRVLSSQKSLSTI